MCALCKYGPCICCQNVDSTLVLRASSVRPSRHQRLTTEGQCCATAMTSLPASRGRNTGEMDAQWSIWQLQSQIFKSRVGGGQISQKESEYWTYICQMDRNTTLNECLCHSVTAECVHMQSFANMTLVLPPNV